MLLFLYSPRLFIYPIYLLCIVDAATEYQSSVIAEELSERARIAGRVKDKLSGGGGNRGNEGLFSLTPLEQEEEENDEEELQPNSSDLPLD